MNSFDDMDGNQLKEFAELIKSTQRDDARGQRRTALRNSIQKTEPIQQTTQAPLQPLEQKT